MIKAPMQILRRPSVLSFRTSKGVRTIGVNSSTVAGNSRQTQDVKPWMEAPGPWSLPVIGPALHFLPGGKLSGYKGSKMTERLYQLYGPLVRIAGSFGGSDMVMLFDPEAGEQIIRSEEPMPLRPAFETLIYYRKRHKKSYDPDRITGLSTDAGEMWRALRSAVNPIMMKPKTIQLYTEVMESIADDMISRMKSMRDEKNKIANFHLDINLWALESIGAVAFGTRLNCFDPNLAAESPARKLIENSPKFFSLVEELDLNPSLWRFYSTPKFKELMNVYEENERCSKYFIDQAIKGMKKSRTADKSHSNKSVLEKFLEIDEQTAYIMGTEMLFGGSDTVATAAVSILYLLAKNPEKQQKLREEILAKSTQRRYLKACIKESMRVLPLFTLGIVRTTTKEYNLLGYNIPKNVSAFICTDYMQLMEKYFPRANEYIPERWLTEKDDPLYHGHTHPFAMISFGYGVRSCIGRRIAELEIETFLSKVIENFQIDWTSDEPVRITSSVINKIVGPYHFVFKDL